MVDLKSQYDSIRDEIQLAINRVLDHCQFVLGPEVESFEEAFAKYCEAKYAVGVNSGSSALYLTLLALGIGPGDEVVTVSHTFVATAEAISWTGAKPVFVDIDEKSLTMDPLKVERALTEKTKVILPVHLYGHPADMDPILSIAKKRNLFVVEDAAQAHGALYKGRRVGALGHAACFSFYPGKNLGCYGEGGAVTTSDPDLAKKIEKLRNHGRLGRQPHEFIGWNARLESLQAAVLSVKLPYLDQWNERRRQHAAHYQGLLKDSGFILPTIASYATSVFHLYVVRSRHRDRLYEHLHDKGIKVQIHYATPAHLLGFYRDIGYGEGDLPITESVCQEILSLPMYPELTKEQLQLVAESILSFDQHAKVN